MEDKHSKTETPSGHKLQKARERGEVFVSRDMISCISLASATMLFIFCLQFFLSIIIKKLRSYLAQITLIASNDNFSATILHIGRTALYDCAIFIFITTSIVAICVILGYAIQYNGFLFSTTSISIDWKRISVLAGFRRIFSTRTFVDLLKGICKICSITYLLYISICDEARMMFSTYQLDLHYSLILLFNLIKKLLLYTCAALLIIGAMDYWYQRRNYMQKMMMSKQERKDEYRQYEGSPEVKSKIRSLRQNIARKNMLRNVKKASVVITNPTHYAVALEYKIDIMSAPVVVAKGLDFLALKIISEAKKYKIPLMANPALARLLYYSVKLDQEIKQEHYAAVAKIISYIMKLQEQTT